MQLGDVKCVNRRVVDAHTHYTNWTQQVTRLEELLGAMTRARVEAATVSGLPCVPTGKGTFTFSAQTDMRLLRLYASLPDAQKSRLYPFLCGINPDDPTSLEAIHTLLSRHPSWIYGFGEILCRHDNMSRKIWGHEIPPTTPTCYQLYDLAAAHNLPVLLHSNVASIEDTAPVYRDEIAAALAHNPQCRILWAHAGIAKDIFIEGLLPTITELLTHFSNLYIDLSWRVHDFYICKDDYSLFAWAELIEHFPDRFVIGTDLTGDYRKYYLTIYRYDCLMNLLSDQTRNMVQRSNAYQLLGIDTRFSHL